ncbi:MAG: DUF4249 domain-containing protein [Luteibaculum sp.]
MKNLFSICGAFALLISCTEPINLNLNTEENIRLAVDAEIDNVQQADTFYLSITSNFFEAGGNVPATNAIVTVTVQDTVFSFIEVGGTGKYYSPPGFRGKPGFTHTLNIQYDGQLYQATSFMRQPVKIDSLTCTRLPEDDFLNPGEVRIGISFQDPPNQRDYYWFIDYVNGANEYSNLFEYGALFNDESIDGLKVENVEYNIFDLEVGDTLTVDMRMISELDEEIISALATESFRGGLFDSPPSNVPSNISNGALGLFIAYPVSRKTIGINK